MYAPCSVCLITLSQNRDARRQAGLLRDFLRREDPEAFLTIVNSSEIIGKGFQSI